MITTSDHDDALLSGGLDDDARDDRTATDLEALKHRLAHHERRDVLVFKFGGTTSGSDTTQLRLRDARRLLEQKLRDGYFVIPVFSALKRDPTDARPRVAITDLLLDYRRIITSHPTLREGAREFRDRLLEPHLELMRDLGLIPHDTSTEDARKSGFKAPNSLLDTIYREVNAIVGDATTFCKFIPGPGAIDNFVSGGERLAVTIIAAYLNEQWRASGFGWRAEPATALEIGILTDDRFGDAHILDESLTVVFGQLNGYRKRKVVPIVTGFDGIHKVVEEGRTHRYRTTLGRSGSDLTATFIGYAMMAEATYLVKDTDGVLSANPKFVPNARPIEYLSYDLAVEAGNIQNKAVQPANDGRMDLIVFNPKNPAVETRIGPPRGDLGLCLITDPKPCRVVGVTLGDVTHLGALLDEVQRFGVQPIETKHTGEHVQIVQAGAKHPAAFEERLAGQCGWKVSVAPAWFLKVVGDVTRDHVVRFNAFIEQFQPLSSAMWFDGARALTATFPRDEATDIGAVIRAIHDEFVHPAVA